MKKIFLSVGVVALGATAVQADTAAGMAMTGDNSKPWSVSATLRAFYDDNYNTTSGTNKHDSFGGTVSPSIAFKFPLDQTTLGFRYTYGATWYQDRTRINSKNNAWDQTHEFEGLFSHNFSSRFSVDAMDSFVISQEPALIAGSGATTFPYRTEGNNVRNHGEITLNGALTRQLSFVLGYQNTYYDYKNVSPGGSSNYDPFTGGVDASLSGLLDRMEHEALANLRWQALPKTVLIAGYNYKLVNYSSDELIANAGSAPGPVFFPSSTNDFRLSKTRDSRSHIFYGGLDQNFSKDLMLSLRAGAQMIDNYKAPANEPNHKTTSPWASLSLTYTYLPGSSVQVGFTHMRNQTDVVTPNAATGSVTSDEQTSVLFGSIHHRFTPKLTGRLSGQWQDAAFFGGFYDGLSEKFFDAGLNFTYRFNEHFSSEIGYNYSTLNSDVPGRDYDRNRVYLGVTAAY